MHDQADQLRKLVRQAVAIDGSLAAGCPVIVVSGARPGTGVTTTACRLAHELANLGKQVVLIDANLTTPNAAKLLTTDRASAPTSPDQAWSGSASITEVLAGTRRAVEVLVSAADGVQLLPGHASAEPPPLDREAVARFLGEIGAITHQCDVVLIDAGSGMNSWIDRLWQFARQVLLVTTPDSTAVLEGYAAVKLAQFHRLDGKLRLLVNRCPNDAEAAPLAKRFDETCRRFLAIATRPPASLPPYSDEPTASDEQFLRASRLLAADLACDFRASALRLPRASSTPPPSHGVARGGISNLLADR